MRHGDLLSSPKETDLDVGISPRLFQLRHLCQELLDPRRILSSDIRLQKSDPSKERVASGKIPGEDSPMFVGKGSCGVGLFFFAWLVENEKNKKGS